MVSVTLLAAQWLLTNVGLPVLKAGIDQLIGQMGMKDTPVADTNEQRLVEVYIQQLDKHIHQLESKIDQKHLAELRGALMQVSEAHKTKLEREFLTEALNTFHVVANYDEQGMTGVYTNKQLRCVAFFGMAAAHAALKDSEELVAEKIAEAVYSDIDTARSWLGNNLVNQIISSNPLPGIVCPKCGHQNPAGSHYCNQDGYPLTPSQNSTPKLPAEQRIQPGSIIKTFDDAVYYDTEQGYSPYSVQSGTLIVRENMLEFLVNQQKIIITDIKHISHAKRNGSDPFNYAKVLYGDDSSLKMVFFRDGSRAFFNSTKSMVEVIQESANRYRNRNRLGFYF